MSLCRDGGRLPLRDAGALDSPMNREPDALFRESSGESIVGISAQAPAVESAACTFEGFVGLSNLVKTAGAGSFPRDDMGVSNALYCDFDPLAALRLMGAGR